MFRTFMSEFSHRVTELSDGGLKWPKTEIDADRITGTAELAAENKRAFRTK